MKKTVMLMALVLVFTSCSSTKKEKELVEVKHEEIRKDYEVRDTSSGEGIRPGWVEDAAVWAEEYGKTAKDGADFRFFSFETEPKVSREIACNLAKANAKADIAGEIATFIDKQLGASTEGSASIDPNNPKTQPLREFVSNTLAEKIMALIHGASIVKTYWEKRDYQKSRGAKADYIGFTCASLVRIPTKELQKAIDEAANHVVNAVDDPGTKENVKKALNDASENFVKAKQGQL
ncbi:MAG: hypothetical protein A2X86_19090 [Bdellovibrionales bacterium GWA2_49_15]|nr:MAG: hypothetical protein A2X86_19090 [Bdellovibrionales bacterium GWA2_49_15]HAZ14333.1 hypothetical protein [Bdellovibrionales bacterium]